MKTSISFNLCVLFLISLPCWGASLDTIQLNSLINEKPVNFSHYREIPLIVIVFEPECPWCLKQFKAYEKLKSDCQDSLQVVAVGVGYRKGLKEMVRKAQISFPAAEATPTFIRLIGQPKATPFSLILDENGGLITSLQGYIPYKKLSHAFQDVCKN